MNPQNLSAAFDTGSTGPASGSIHRPAHALNLAKRFYRATEPVSFRVDNANPDEVSIVVTDTTGAPIEVPIEKSSVDGGVIVTFAQRLHFHPGLYHVSVLDNGQVISTQDFTWGVLAINTNKATYAPGETADIALAVLDDRGVMVCNADVTLIIQNPKGDPTTLTTADGSIVINPDCNIHDMTEKPDYEAHYVTGESGQYSLQLTAKTQNGVYSISDAFQVDGKALFDIERVSATRLFPAKAYPMSLKVTARTDFTGSVTETVPDDFGVYPLAGTTPYNDTSIISDTSMPASGSATKISLRLPFEGNFQETQGFGAKVTDVDLLALYHHFGIAGHDGIDYNLPIGTPVYAVDEGTVTHAADQPYGLTVIIQHSWGFTYYGHLSKFLVAEGDHVTKGQEIAISGATGEGTGPHLHFGMRLNSFNVNNGYYGKINPEPYLTASSAVISDTTVKKIRWDISMKKGETTTLGYTYQAPLISPQFYLLGPLEFRGDLSASGSSNLSASASGVLGDEQTASDSATPTAIPTLTPIPSPTVTPTPTLIPDPATPSAASTAALNSVPTPSPIIVTADSLSTASGSSELATGSANLTTPPSASGSAGLEAAGSGMLVFTEARQWQLAADTIGGWYDSNWLYRTKITFDHTKDGTVDSTNYPALINSTIGTWAVPGSGGHMGLSDAGDIRFTDSTSTTLLHSQIELYTSTSGLLTAWVNIPTLSASNDTVIYMYYGNASAADVQSDAATWTTSGNFDAVWHLNAGSNTDSSGNSNTLTRTGTPTNITAQIAGGVTDASGQFFTSSTATSVPGANAAQTISAWGRQAATPTSRQNLVTVSTAASSNGNQIGYNGSGNPEMWQWGALAMVTCGSTSPSLNVWHLYTYTWDGTNNRLYVDGTQCATTTTAHTQSGAEAQMLMGDYSGGAEYWIGSMDEGRVEDGARSTSWITASYNNQWLPSTFYTIAAEEKETPETAQCLHHCEWFNHNGVRQPFFWAI